MYHGPQLENALEETPFTMLAKSAVHGHAFKPERERPVQ